jgi:hypothetical protein
MENKQKLLQIISDSSLADHDKKKWAEFFDANPETALAAYLDIFSVFPEEIEWFNRMMKRKMAAMLLINEGNEKGGQEMKRIAEEEKIKINELEKKI